MAKTTKIFIKLSISNDWMHFSTSDWLFESKFKIATSSNQHVSVRHQNISGTSKTLLSNHWTSINSSNFWSWCDSRWPPPQLTDLYKNKNVFYLSFFFTDAEQTFGVLKNLNTHSANRAANPYHIFILIVFNTDNIACEKCINICQPLQTFTCRMSIKNL